MHNLRFLLIVSILFAAVSQELRAQAQDVAGEVEVGAQFSLLYLSNFRGTARVAPCFIPPCPFVFNDFARSREAEPGFGGRVSYNVTEHLTLEAEGNFFPRDDEDSNGRVAQGLFGVKAGKRFERFGVFGKARPGFVSMSRGDLRERDDFACITIFPPPAACFVARRTTDFAFDLGGVVELYPTRRAVLRFDAGDTIIRQGERAVAAILVQPPGVFAPTRLVAVRVSSETTHNFQASVGVGFRF